MTKAVSPLWQTSTLDLNFTLGRGYWFKSKSIPELRIQWQIKTDLVNSTLVAETGNNENLCLSLCDQLDKRLFINLMINRFLENINLALYYIFNINNSQYFKKLTKSGTKSSIVHNLVTCYKSWRRRLVLLFTPQWILQGNNGNNESFAMSLSSRYFYSSESLNCGDWRKRGTCPAKTHCHAITIGSSNGCDLAQFQPFFQNSKSLLKPT